MSGALAEQAASMPAATNPLHKYPPLGRAVYTIAVLMVVSFVSLLDRSLPNLLVAPIRAEFTISDTGMSMLQGTAFGILYAALGIPFGRLVDKVNRRNIIFFGFLLWTTMTMLSAFAGSFSALLVARMGVGIGEACLAPAAYTMISDLVRPESRGRAIGIYYASLGAGTGASLLVGGMILDALGNAGLVLPSLSLTPWRALFFVAGVMGLVFAGLVLTIKEPDRINSSADPGASDIPSIPQVLAYFGRNLRTFACLYLSFGLFSFTIMGVIVWAPTYFVRYRGEDIGNVGQIMGAIQIGCTIGGNLMGGWLSDRLANAGRHGARLEVAVLGWLLFLPASAMWTVMPGYFGAMTALGVVMFAGGLISAAAPTSVQESVSPRMRGVAISVYLLISGLFGLGLGPSGIAVVADYLVGGDNGLAVALIAVPSIGSAFGLILAALGLRSYARTVGALS